ncbi:MAG: thiamine diphosphokinase [Eubacteriales bacterium]
MSICYIVGPLEHGFKINKQKGDYIIAADAGYLRLGGISPDLVIGDFDSLGFIPENVKIELHPTEKDDTDTLLAVKAGLSRGANRFVLLGCAGGRLDHTIANLQTLIFIAENGAEGFLFGEVEVVTAVKNGSVSFAEGLSGNVSVFSAGSVSSGVYISGLKYTLENMSLTNSFPLGASNAFTGEKAVIKVTDGILLVVFQIKTASVQAVLSDVFISKS